jgi:hypothetical protein
MAGLSCQGRADILDVHNVRADSVSAALDTRFEAGHLVTVKIIVENDYGKTLLTNCSNGAFVAIVPFETLTDRSDHLIRRY